MSTNRLTVLVLLHGISVTTLICTIQTDRQTTSIDIRYHYHDCFAVKTLLQRNLT